MKNVRTSLRTLLVTAAALVLASTNARAQDSLTTSTDMSVASSGLTSTHSISGPTRASARVAVHSAGEDARALPVAAGRHGGFGQDEALMIVGGVAILAGIVVGGSAGYAISIGGAVVGLIGLYQYLQ